MDKARAIMVLGTTSGAGKSWLATALCRWYARQGLKVAPFKAQNMSNNARVVAMPGAGAGCAGEIGSAQFFQALAARVRPEVRMNPVLLKPERDDRSQVIVLGRARPDLAQVSWRERSEVLWPYAREALNSLMADNEVVVIEGAGSPAEINLHASDYVNMRIAKEARAACLLVTDIDRGGAFAHLFGTHRLLPPKERALIRGFVLNKFRGDPSLLAPGPEQLEQLIGVPTLAVLPLWREHGLPEEDGVVDTALRGNDQAVRIAVVAYPRISNLDEFEALRQAPGVQLFWARTPADVHGADWIVLPGSKHVAGDLAWLREQALDEAVIRHAGQGGNVLGICGGLQMLGEGMSDPHGVDGDAVGLGLLPLRTVFEESKLLRRTAARFGSLTGQWQALCDIAFNGYEIRHGRTKCRAADDATLIVLRSEAGEPIGWQRGSILGICTHGLFESPAAMQVLFGASPSPLDKVFDGLADFIDRHFEPGALRRLLNA